LVDCGANALSDDEVGRMVGDGAATLIARAFDASRLPKPPDALQRFLAIYDEHLTDHTRPYDGIVSVLTSLSGHASLAVLTNKPLGATRRLLERLDLSRFFAAAFVLGGDGPWPRKPDPSGLRDLMQRAGAGATETLLVGDSPIDRRTARAAPSAICVARYGFGYAGFSVDDLTDVDMVVDAPNELLGL